MNVKKLFISFCKALLVMALILSIPASFALAVYMIGPPGVFVGFIYIITLTITAAIYDMDNS